MNRYIKHIIQTFPVSLWLSFIVFILIIVEIGFSPAQWFVKTNKILSIIALLIGVLSIISRYLRKGNVPSFKVFGIDALFILFLLTIFIIRVEGIDFYPLEFLENDAWLKIAIVFLFLRELFTLKLKLKYAKINPAQLFIVSFLVIIILGSLLLLLPNATSEQISYIDALFTSTSAVCVTGLTVVDTATFYTPIGQAIILMLIQIGGLGIMTFVSYFSYFFMGTSTYENQLILSEMTNNEKLGEVFNMLKKIIIVTFSIEIIGAILIFQTIDNEILSNFNDKLFFSFFHSISGFCNAGFSTLTSSLYESTFRFNYPLHLIISVLFIIGGLGFPIIFNLWKYVKNKLSNLFKLIIYKKRDTYLPWVLNIDSKIIISTTLFLILFGTMFILIFEYNNTLSEHGFFGKIITAFFGSVTTRTAGFNTVDTAALTLPTTLIVIFLMWVGASPASTGGGIKTSTFALAFLNIISLVKGKNRVELFGREISQISINRAFTIIILSISVISLSIFGLVVFDAKKGFMDIIFECVSAYSTVGLSRGITAELSNPSKIVIIFTMFIGRVSMFTVLIAFIKKVSHKKYRFPKEEILIN